MTRWFLLFVSAMALLSGCGEYQVKYGVPSQTGYVHYSLCEKAKQRITDMQRISFELPPLFKQASCRNWPDYGYDARQDHLSVEIPGVIANDTLKSIGGVHAMSFYAGPRREYYLSPQVFFEDYSQYLSERRHIAHLVKADWVDWSGGLCARFYSENNSVLYLFREVEYLCWEAVSGSNYPIHISASEKLPPGYTPTNLDSEMIEPVLSSLQIHPVPTERLTQWASDVSTFCTMLKKNYDEKTAVKLTDGPNRRRTIRYLRECGYEMPDPVGIEGWRELFKPDGQLIGRADGEDAFRRVTHEQFAELEAKLMSLQPTLGQRPEVRIRGLSANGKYFVEKYRLTGPYEGDWYKIPPYYNDRHGFGIRHDPVLGRVIDVHIGDLGLPLGFRVVGE